MTSDEAVGLAIKQSRMEQGLSQESIGASQSFVSDIERGKKSVTIQRLDAFAQCLGVQPVTLLVKAALLANPNITMEELFESIRAELKKYNKVEFP